MLELLQPLALASFLAIAANRIIEAIATPVRKKWPAIDMWWLIYVAWLVAGMLSYAAGLDLFGSVFPQPMVGRLLTAVVVGGGANLLHDLFPGSRALEFTATLENTDSGSR